MAKDTYYPQMYKNSEGGIETHYVWSSKIEETVHTSTMTGETLTCDHLYIEDVPAAPAIKTPTKKRHIQQERKVRSQNHFKKEIYPTLKPNSTEQKHFAKKYGLKKG